MVINKDGYQISQKTGEKTIIIYKDGKFYRAITGIVNMSYNELLKVLEAYRND